MATSWKYYQLRRRSSSQTSWPSPSNSTAHKTPYSSLTVTWLGLFKPPQPLCTSLLTTLVFTIFWHITRERRQWRKEKMSSKNVSVTWILPSLVRVRVLFQNWEWGRKRKEDFMFFFPFKLSFFGFYLKKLIFLKKLNHKLVIDSWFYASLYESSRKTILWVIPLIFAF